ncbi:uncharacterized protein BDR25DRAFT_317614 [Lindgomyces ingoldianus]|uniref:Uncharacterized protein n=1 Tax=Lindgomyces ingoldianus TaxID=673940 RepID=A0ACB6QJE1_9PLEO|nr:uncharacterized protein BDR25DRAFT_317614 [Lindgomyces ingoldianus]KAF2466630.1 hypothetical protein BDR25DRAFT_317614 [Lindgomyces ingoldianus]
MRPENTQNHGPRETNGFGHTNGSGHTNDSSHTDGTHIHFRHLATGGIGSRREEARTRALSESFDEGIRHEVGEESGSEEVVERSQSEEPEIEEEDWRSQALRDLFTEMAIRNQPLHLHIHFH